MAVDVLTRITIDRPVETVARYSADPSNAPEWYVKIRSVTWMTEPPLDVGTRLEFVAHFLGKRLRYTYEVAELVPQHHLVMRTADGPFPMETTYRWLPAGDATTMELRNRGEPTGFSRLAARFMATAMRRANRADLRRLKSILESR